MTENFDGKEKSFLFASLDRPLKRRDPGWHTHSKQKAGPLRPGS
jgi:hypothetical protein